MLAPFPFRCLSSWSLFLTQTIHTQLVHRSHNLLQTASFRLQIFFSYVVPAYHFTLHLSFQTLTLFRLNWFFLHFPTKTTIITQLFPLLPSSGRDHQNSHTITRFNRSCSTAHFCFFPSDLFYPQHLSLLLYTVNVFYRNPATLWQTRTVGIEYYRWDKTSTLATRSSRSSPYSPCLITLYLSKRVTGHNSASVFVPSSLSSGAT